MVLLPAVIGTLVGAVAIIAIRSIVDIPNALIASIIGLILKSFL